MYNAKRDTTYKKSGWISDETPGYKVFERILKIRKLWN